MIQHGFVRSLYDHCVYHKWLDSDVGIFLLLYMDDMLIASVYRLVVQKLKQQLGKVFEMKDLGKPKKILGMELRRNEEGDYLKVSQTSYLLKVLDKFGMSNSKPVSTPTAHHFKFSTQMCPESEEEKELMNKVPYAITVGSVMYSMVCTRPDLSFTSNLISRFMANPGKGHLNAVK